MARASGGGGTNGKDPRNDLSECLTQMDSFGFANDFKVVDTNQSKNGTYYRATEITDININLLPVKLQRDLGLIIKQIFKWNENCFCRSKSHGSPFSGQT